MDYEPIQMNPVGIVRNKSRNTVQGTGSGTSGWKERAARMKAQRDSISEIILDGVPEETLDGIEDYSHITVIYWAHLVTPERRSTTFRVHPTGNPDFPLVGVYATGSPVRPNPVLVTTVRLLERSGNTLRVTGLDALDGSPVLDIKPYYPAIAEEDIRVPDWMQQVNREFRSAQESD